MFISYAPEFDIAACGETVEEAKQNLLHVLQINFDDMRQRGTLDRFLRDAGFEKPDSNENVLQLDKELIGFEPREVAF